MDEVLAAVAAVGEGDQGASISGFGDIGDVDVAAQFDLRVVGEIGAQQSFQRWLVEHVRRGVAVTALRGVAVELGEHPHLRVDQP